MKYDEFNFNKNYANRPFLKSFAFALCCFVLVRLCSNRFKYEFSFGGSTRRGNSVILCVVAGLKNRLMFLSPGISFFFFLGPGKSEAFNYLICILFSPLIRKFKNSNIQLIKFPTPGYIKKSQLIKISIDGIFLEISEGHFSVRHLEING